MKQAIFVSLCPAYIFIFVWMTAPSSLYTIYKYIHTFKPYVYVKVFQLKFMLGYAFYYFIIELKVSNFYTHHLCF